LTEDACQQITFPDAGDFSSPGQAKALRRMWSLRAFPAVIIRYQTSSQSATCQALIIESIPDHPAAPQRAAKTVSQTCWDRGSLKPQLPVGNHVTVRTRDELSQNRTLQPEVSPALPPNPLKINVSINKDDGSLLALGIPGEYLWTSHVSPPSDNGEFAGSSRLAKRKTDKGRYVRLCRNRR
jgi:hypothetical protein